MQRFFLVVSGLILASQPVLTSCSKKSVPVNSGADTTVQVAFPGPPCIVYKTTLDFSTQVPVEMTPDGSRIASFPDVADIYKSGELAYPTPLKDGYLLDNRGIGPGVAFLKYTYEDYRKLDQTPASSELFDAILDRDPLLEMYQCGNRSQFKDVVNELNELISSGKLTNCKKLK